jgi:hypothetical protein
VQPVKVQLSAAARRTAHAGQCHRPQSGRCVLAISSLSSCRKQRRSSSSSAGRKSRETEGQPQCAQSMKTWPFVTAKNRCQTYSTCRPVSQPPKWQVRTCEKQAEVGQIARRSRSSSAGRKSRETEYQSARAVNTTFTAAAKRTRAAIIVKPRI